MTDLQRQNVATFEKLNQLTSTIFAAHIFFKFYNSLSKLRTIRVEYNYFVWRSNLYLCHCNIIYLQTYFIKEWTYS